MLRFGNAMCNGTNLISIGLPIDKSGYVLDGKDFIVHKKYIHIGKCNSTTVPTFTKLEMVPL